MLSESEIAGFAAEALARRARELDAAQAVHGLDAMSELELHPVLAGGYRGNGYEVLQEVRYPGEPERRPSQTERERCDLVLLPEPGTTLVDPVQTLRDRDRARGTLFEGFEPEPGTGCVPPDLAWWIEVKAIGQLAYIEGVPGPNRRYAAELMACGRDLAKLSRDRWIVHGVSLMLVFTSDADIADHDLAAALHGFLDRGLRFGSPSVERVKIADRIGNTCLTVAAIPSRPEHTADC